MESAITQQSLCACSEKVLTATAMPMSRYLQFHCCPFPVYFLWLSYFSFYPFIQWNKRKDNLFWCNSSGKLIVCYKETKSRILPASTPPLFLTQKKFKSSISWKTKQKGNYQQVVFHWLLSIYYSLDMKTWAGGRSRFNIYGRKCEQRQNVCIFTFQIKTLQTAMSTNTPAVGVCS